MDSMGNVASMSNDLSTDEWGMNRKSQERDLRVKTTNSIFFEDCWVDHCFVHTLPYITKNLEIKSEFLSLNVLAKHRIELFGDVVLLVLDL